MYCMRLLTSDLNMSASYGSTTLSLIFFSLTVCFIQISKIISYTSTFFSNKANNMFY
jgi:hypothetical protein